MITTQQFLSTLRFFFTSGVSEAYLSHHITLKCPLSAMAVLVNNLKSPGNRLLSMPVADHLGLLMDVGSPTHWG